jgi:hypothetical protein
MNPYVVSLSGEWPNEQYVYTINENVIDSRLNQMPVRFICAPYYSEDHNYADTFYDPPGLNSLIGVSSNSYYFITPNNLEFNVKLKSDLTFVWNPSSLRYQNYGNFFNVLMLQTEQPIFYGASVYPSQLFLYPVSSVILKEYQITTSDYVYVTAYDAEDYGLFKNTEFLNEFTAQPLLTPLVSTLFYITTSSGIRSTNSLSELISFFNSTTGIVDYFIDINEPVSSVYYSISSGTYYPSVINLNDLNIFLTVTSANFYTSSILINQASAIAYNTLVYNLTGQTFWLQTSTVLLSAHEFQFSTIGYGNSIKTQHSKFLSTKPSVANINYQNINIDNIVYELSGVIVHGQKNVVSFEDDINPIYYNTLLEPIGSYIRPDTTRLSYFVDFYDYSGALPFIRGLGDSFDDNLLEADRSIESSYILRHNNNNKLLTFQLLQSSINPTFSLESAENCVLSAVLDYDTSRFYYYNTGKFIYNPENFGVVTPISGVRNSNLSLRYIAETPYILNTQETVSSTLLSISSYPTLKLNTPITWSNHNKTVNWQLKYPPYYYTFKNSYKKGIYNYQNKNTLNFYISSALIKTDVFTFVDDYRLDYATATLHTSIYSDFDIIELPLKEYSTNDLISFKLNSNSLLNLNLLSAYLVSADNPSDALTSTDTIYYDISASPYIPAASGTYLRLVYDIENGGTIISIRPSLSTQIGTFEGYWANTFALALDYQPRKFIKPLKIETQSQNVSSVVVTIKHLSGFNETGADLSLTRVLWNIDPPENLIISNLDTNQILNLNDYYLFEDAHTLKIDNVGNTSFVVYLSSEQYLQNVSKKIEPDFFDLYSENKALVVVEEFENKEKIKKLKLNSKIPYYGKIFDVEETAIISWEWAYKDANNTQVSAYYYNGNQKLPYVFGQTDSVFLLSSIYFDIESDYTLTEQYIPLDVTVEVGDQGKNMIGVSSIFVNSYPDPSIFNTHFNAYYENFLTSKILDTQQGLKSLTREPKGTNVFKFIPEKLNSALQIGNLRWQIDSSKFLEHTTNTTEYTEIIEISSNPELEFYDPSITKDFNLYTVLNQNYLNLEYLNGITAVPVLSLEQLNNIYYALSSPNLKNKNSILEFLSAKENSFPLATSITVITTSFYESIFDSSEEYKTLNGFDNLYTTYFYTSTLSAWSESDLILNLDYEYTGYVANYWLSSKNVIVSDDLPSVTSFVDSYITNKNNVLNVFTTYNYTTSLSYTISSRVIDDTLYFLNTVSLIASGVYLPEWDVAYNFKESASVIIVNEGEFTTTPFMYVIPKFIWAPDGNKKATRYLTITDIENPSTYSSIVGNKTYTNNKNQNLICGIQIDGVQDRALESEDSLVFIFGTDTDNGIQVLADSIIDQQNEYKIAGYSRVIVSDFKLPYHSNITSVQGQNVYLTAFNKFFPPEGGLTFLSLKSLTAQELTTDFYPITTKTEPRSYDTAGALIGNILLASPRVYDYEPCKLMFYPKIKTIDVDEGGLIQVKQIVETNPVNSPNIIDYDQSTVTYILSSDYWTQYLTVPAMSSSTISLFNLTIGDPFKPLQVSKYNTQNLVLQASARIASRIPSTTFNKYSSAQYTGDRDLWQTVFVDINGNEEMTYKILVPKISTTTEYLSTYQPFSVKQDWVISI